MEEKQNFVLKKEIKGLAKWEEHFILECLERGRKTSNHIKGEKLPKFKEMINLKQYIRAKHKYGKYKNYHKKIEKKIKNDEYDKKQTSKAKKTLNKLTKMMKKQTDNLNKIQYQYGFYKMGFLGKEVYESSLELHNEYLDAGLIQSVSEDVWKSYKSILFGDGKEIHFIKFGNFNTLRGRNNESFLRYEVETDELIIGRKNSNIAKLNKKNGTHKFDGQLRIHIPRNLKDDFEVKAFAEHKIKYCILKKEYIRKKIKFYIEIVFEGESPNAEKLRQQYNGCGTLGIDVGVQHMATYNDRQQKADIFEMAEGCNNPHKEIAEVKRKMTRSRKAMNKQQFNEDGTIDKGKKCKNVSKRYQKLLMELKELYRKPAAKRELAWQCYSKKAVLSSEKIIVEDDNKKEWQKRLKEGKGKHNSKKHYGCYIENKAPAKGLELIERKSKYVRIPYQKVGVQSIKATQYNHIDDSFDIDKKLTNRWNYDERDSQRDLTSAMYLTCLKDGKIDKDIVNKKWDDFKNAHNEEINKKIVENKNGKLLLGAMGLQQRYPNIKLKSNNINAH